MLFIDPLLTAAEVMALTGGMRVLVIWVFHISFSFCCYVMVRSEQGAEQHYVLRANKFAFGT